MPHTTHYPSLSDFFQSDTHHEILFLELRYLDLNGCSHMMTLHRSALSDCLIEDGSFIDGSSIAGWTPIEKGDLLLKPDLKTLQRDPFSQHRAFCYCSVYQDAETPYLIDPRDVANRAETYLSTLGIADTAFVGPELEFFLFDQAMFSSSFNTSFYHLASKEIPTSSPLFQQEAADPYAMAWGGGYAPLAPQDHNVAVREEILQAAHACNIKVDKHHHEVAPAQQEIGIVYSTLSHTCHNIALLRNLIQQVSTVFQKRATFMPKPLAGDNGSGMHVHFSLFKDGVPLFPGNQSCGLSPIAHHFIAGIIEHAQSLAAFTNCSINSYHRLVPGFEAPVHLAYSEANRSAAIRIPHTTSDQAKRVEVRFPDPLANPFLAFPALLMAGLDGIKRQLCSGEPTDVNLYQESASKPQMPTSLREALEALQNNHEFLLQGGVFSKELIKNYIELKEREITLLSDCPHPKEFELYFSR